jgi:hypothetical protein
MMEHTRVKALLFASFLACCSALLAKGGNIPHQPPSASTIAVLGDNLATGAGASPLFKYDADLLWDIFKKQNLSSPAVPPEIATFTKGAALTPPETLWLTEREYSGSLAWVFKHFWASFAKVYLDTEEFSWGYLTAKALGVPSSQIFLAAEDGASISMLPRQIDRLLHGREGKLPQKIFVLFTYHDVCAQRPEVMTSVGEFRQTLLRGLQYLLRNGQAADTGTEIYILGSLGLTQLLTKNSIVNKALVAHGEPTTCSELRARSYQPSKPSSSNARHMESLYFQHLLPPNPAHLCPTLFAQKFIAQSELGIFSSLNKKSRGKKIEEMMNEMLSSVANRIRGYRSASKHAVQEAEAWAKKEKIPGNFSLHYVGDTEGIEFEAEDVADDCFHLSWQGQLKIAKKLYGFIAGS